MELSAGDGSKKVLRVWLSIAGILICALFSAAGGLLTPWLLIITAAAGVLTPAAALWYPSRYCASVKGSFDGQAVDITRGVFWKKRLYVPVSSLRTVEYWQTPLQRRFDCCTVVLRFAGGAAPLTVLSGKAGESLAEAIEAISAIERQ